MLFYVQDMERVALFQPLTKLVVAHFQMFWGTAEALPSHYWGSFNFHLPQELL